MECVTGQGRPITAYRGGAIVKHTIGPWYATGIHVQSAVLNEDNYVCEAEGSTLEEAEANAEFIVRACNHFDKEHIYLQD